MSNSAFHEDVNIVTPASVSYEFPTQLTKAVRQRVKIPAGTGISAQGQLNRKISFTLPSDGYVNLRDSTIEFDLTLLQAPGGSPLSAKHSKVTVTWTLSGNVISLAASTFAADDDLNGYFLIPINYPPLEDVPLYITDSTASGQVLTIPFRPGYPGTGSTVSFSAHLVPGVWLQEGGAHELFNRVTWYYGSTVVDDVTQYGTYARLQMLSTFSSSNVASTQELMEGVRPLDFVSHADNRGLVNKQLCRALLEACAPYRRYSLSLKTGFSQLDKELATKWSAPQWRLDLMLEDAKQCIISQCPALQNIGYSLTNLNFDLEVRNYGDAFDSGYVARGLMGTGIPFLFDNVDEYRLPLTSNTATVSIPTRARSIRGIVAVIRDTDVSFPIDSKNFYYNTGQKLISSSSIPALDGDNSNMGVVDEYSFRIGSRVYPAQPVECKYGCVESYKELLNFFNIIGRNQVSNQLDVDRWMSNFRTYPDGSAVDNLRQGKYFAIYCSLENSDAFPDTISGVNGEDIQDLSFKIKFTDSVVAKNVQVFVPWNKLLIHRGGNIIQQVV